MRLCRLAVNHVALMAGMLMLGAGVWGQAPDPNTQSGIAQQTTEIKKPARKVKFVTTTDPVALLAVRRGPEILEAPRLQPVVPGPNLTADASVDEKAKKAAEIAETERLIKEKQQRILLLLRLFATDEQMFLRDPSAAESDSSVQERRKYSQDELLWETAELARLKKRMNELEASR